MNRAEEYAARYQERAERQYREELLVGKHDEHCEWRPGCYLCHCHKRKREAEGVTEPPALLFNDPTCMGCWQDVQHDGDGWTCRRCAVSWGNDPERGEFTDDYGNLS